MQPSMVEKVARRVFDSESDSFGGFGRLSRLQPCLNMSEPSGCPEAHCRCVALSTMHFVAWMKPDDRRFFEPYVSELYLCVTPLPRPYFHPRGLLKALCIWMRLGCEDLWRADKLVGVKTTYSEKRSVRTTSLSVRHTLLLAWQRLAAWWSPRIHRSKCKERKTLEIEKGWESWR